MAGQEIIIKGRVHNTRGTGSLCFLVIRQQYGTIQAIVSADETISKGMVKFANKTPKESIIEIKAIVQLPKEQIATCSQNDVELAVKEFWILNKSAPILPF